MSDEGNRKIVAGGAASVATVASAAERRAERIAAARTALAEAYAANPDGVDRYNSRMARIEAARKRQRERVDHLVLGKAPDLPEIKRPDGMSRREWKKRRPKLVAERKAKERELARRWALTGGTTETVEHHRRHAKNREPLVRMLECGEIDHHQKAWADEIAMVAEGIEADVGVRAASYEGRVDNEGAGRDRHIEGIVRVRRHVAYTRWREQLPQPKRLVLDMIVGQQMSYHTAARLHRVGWKRARRLLIEALDRWPGCAAHARAVVDERDVERVNSMLYDTAA